ncbi:MAG: hypothetical protein C1943_00455 [Halochromatium sp.]|nr:hypothetical protein [Halochromatium sp.]
MITLPLIQRHGHLFIELQGHLWLFDTGAPTSFGDARSLQILGERFDLSPSDFGLSASSLSQAVGVTCSGLLGADLLNAFDYLIDIAAGRLTVSKNALTHDGQPLPLDDFMGIPWTFRH